MDFSRLNTGRVAVGAAASLILILSLFFLPWFSLESFDQRELGNDAYNPDTFICGAGDFECTGFETFPILRWFILLAAIAPLILGYIIVRGFKLSYPPGEMTMVAGFAALMLIGYNGIIDKPGSGPAEIGVSIDYGYWIALACAILIASVGFTRSLESGGKKQRKAPGTV